ncbi:MAG TPA: ABC transporter transmembrane domain-containing protein, partial [Chitinophaga sp.]
MQTPEIPAARPSFSLAAFRKTFRLYRYVKPYWPQFLAGMFFLLASSVTSLFFPQWLGKLVTAAGSGGLPHLHAIGLTLAGLLVAQALFSFLRTIFFVNVTEQTLAALRGHIYHHLILLPMSFFATRRVGELTSRISSDISLLQETFTTTLAEFVRQLVVIIGGLVLLLRISASLTFFMLCIVPVISLLALFFGKFIRSSARLAQTQVSEANTIVEETLQGILNVKAFTNETFEVKRYRQQTQAAARTGMRVGMFRGLFSSFFILGIFGAMVAVIWKGALLIAAHRLEAGPLFSFVIYSGFIGGAIAGLADVYATLQKSIGATEHLLEILDVPAEPLEDLPQLPPDCQLQGGITFCDVSFHYPSRPDVQVLQHISFTVAPNQRVALAGPSGAGKSTLVALLLRLYDP